MSFFYNAERDIQRLRLEMRAQNQTINTKLDRLLMNQDELQAALESARTEVATIRTEQEARFKTQSDLVESLSAKVAALSEQLNQGGAVAPGVEAAFTGLRDDLKAFNDTIPNAA